MIRPRWGSFSVRDHLKEQAFVAELLLYDRLVIPVPPPNNEGEWRRWARNTWKPDRQAELLQILGKDLCVRLPWTKELRHQHRTYLGTRGVRLNTELLRDAVALVRDDEYKRNRIEFYEWGRERVDKGHATDESIERMRSLLDRHEQIVRKAWKDVAWKESLPSSLSAPVSRACSGPRPRLRGLPRQQPLSSSLPLAVASASLRQWPGSSNWIGSRVFGRVRRHRQR